MGGGILPIAHYKNKTYLLFGKEAYDGKWSDFGGKAEHNETPFDTAIREGCEELCGFLGCKSALKSLVRKNKRATFHVNGFHTYVFEIPYDPLLPSYFNQNFSFIKKNLPHLVNVNGMFEKSQIKWFDISTLHFYKKNFRPFYKNMLETILQNSDNL